MIDEELQSSEAADEQPTHVNPEQSQSAVAAERWLAEHGDVLWRFVLGRVRVRDIAEDVVQETVLAALQARGSFAGGSSERTWLLGIAAHKIADHFRAMRRRSGHTHSTEGPHGAGSGGAGSVAAGSGRFDDTGRWAMCPGDIGMSGGTRKTDAETLVALRECLDALPPSLGEAVWLRDLLGLPAEEVCKAMGITPTNLWSRMHRARMALRECVERRMGTGKEGSR